MQYVSARFLLIASTFLAAFSAVAVGQITLLPPKFLYSSDFTDNKILGYTVNPTTGTIKPTAQGSVPTHTGPTRVASDKGGYRLYVINQSSKDLSAYFIYRNDGSLHSVPGSPFAIGETPNGIAVAPSGKYVYVTTLKSVNSPQSWVYAFAVESNGSLKPIPGSPFSTVNWAGTLTVDPQGKYLYVSSVPLTSTPSKSEIDAYSINATDGALTPVPGSPYTEPNSPYCANGAWDIAVHPSGNFLVIPNLCAGVIVNRIERSTGTLTLVKGSPFHVNSPFDVESIAMDPAGKYFWVSTQYCHGGCGSTNETWTINATTGVPTYLSQSNYAGCGLLQRVDPSGKFLYAIGNIQSNGGCGYGVPPGIWGLGITRSNGSLHDISGSPWKSPNGDAQYWLNGLAVTP